MKHLVSERLASYGLASILLFFLLFHSLIMLHLLPDEMVWGGKLTDQKQMLSLELIALVVTLLMLAVVGIKTGLIPIKVNPAIIKVALWVMFGMFLLNTLGNMASLNALERYVFAPLTLLLSLFCYRLAVSKRPPDETAHIS